MTDGGADDRPGQLSTQTQSLYRKLGAVTRSEAVARSRELTLLEG